MVDAFISAAMAVDISPAALNPISLRQNVDGSGAEKMPMENLYLGVDESTDDSNWQISGSMKPQRP